MKQMLSGQDDEKIYVFVIFKEELSLFLCFLRGVCMKNTFHYIVSIYLVQQSKWDQKQTTLGLNSKFVLFLLFFMHRCFNWLDSLAKLVKYFKVSKNHFTVILDSFWLQTITCQSISLFL